jgi:hypothetical protein
MPGVRKARRGRRFGRAFPHSQYDDPRGGRPAALERNILRYRATEVALYLFYAEAVRNFMLTTVYPSAIKNPSASPFEPTEEQRLATLMFRLLRDAESAGTLSAEDASKLRLSHTGMHQLSRQLKLAFGHSVKIGMFTAAEVNELAGLLDYRNHIAHRIHLLMSDVGRSYFAVERLEFAEPLYKQDALDRLRAFHGSLWNRTKRSHITIMVSLDRFLFESAERVYRDELKRLERLIEAQIPREQDRLTRINVELDISGTEFVDDLDPRHPGNHYRNRRDGPDSGRLTKRGVEICYRLLDLGKSPIAVAYLMGMSLRAAEGRRRSWVKAGGQARTRATVAY